MGAATRCVYGLTDGAMAESFTPLADYADRKTFVASHPDGGASGDASLVFPMPRYSAG
ncbi:MAG: hypothetical protein ACJAZO_003231, partial [Myxococcota bacterium]